MKTEKQHAGEFIATNEAESISFDTVVLAAGHSVVDGAPLVKNGANIEPADGSLASDGSLAHPFVGLVIGDHDTSGGAKAVPVAARLLEVDSSLLHYPVVASGGNQANSDAAMDSALSAVFIVKR